MFQEHIASTIGVNAIREGETIPARVTSDRQTVSQFI
jgi:hypothetical protein